jgi:hypothetical protein
MHYEKSNNKTTLINCSSSGAGPPWITNHPQIQRIRSHLLILLSIQLVS